MLSYCLKCRSKTDSKNVITKTNKGKLIILSECSSCDTKKSRFMMKQEPNELLGTISKIPLICSLLIPLQTKIVVILIYSKNNVILLFEV